MIRLSVSVFEDAKDRLDGYLHIHVLGTWLTSTSRTHLLLKAIFTVVKYLHVFVWTDEFSHVLGIQAFNLFHEVVTSH